MREEGETFEPNYRFLALSSKKLSANRQTDGRKLENMYYAGSYHAENNDVYYVVSIFLLFYIRDVPKKLFNTENL